MIAYLKAADQIAELGLDNSEFLARAKFVEIVRVSIERGDVGFRRGWVSSAHIVSDLHPRKWAGLLEAMGYELHPSLGKTGRTQLIEGEGRTRLFIQKGHEMAGVELERHAVKHYRSAQM